MTKNNLAHRFEVAFCGYSGSGKSTLIQKLLHNLSSQHKVGYLKHDAHSFQMDVEGKDTDMAFKAGSHLIAINSQQEWAMRGLGSANSLLTKEAFLDCDFVLIEGYKNSKIPKYLVIDSEGKIFEEYLKGQYENVLGLILPDNFEVAGEGLITFHRNQVAEIQEHLLTHLKSKATSPLYGLVLAGGKSTRMQSDKGALQYYGKPQVQHIGELIKPYVEEVYVSVREEQKEQEHVKNLPQIQDQFLGLGPMGGILSAQMIKPQAAWLVVAVDLPFLNHQGIEKLLAYRNPFKMATSFWNEEKKWPEPLVSIWEPQSYCQLLRFLADGRTCPRKVLFNSNIEVVRNFDQNVIRNVNDRDELARVQNEISNQVRF